jgi:hypothetical protein
VSLYVSKDKKHAGSPFETITIRCLPDKIMFVGSDTYSMLMAEKDFDLQCEPLDVSVNAKELLEAVKLSKDNRTMLNISSRGVEVYYISTNFVEVPLRGRAITIGKWTPPQYTGVDALPSVTLRDTHLAQLGKVKTDSSGWEFDLPSAERQPVRATATDGSVRYSVYIMPPAKKSNG